MGFGDGCARGNSSWFWFSNLLFLWMGLVTYLANEMREIRFEQSITGREILIGCTLSNWCASEVGGSIKSNLESSKISREIFEANKQTQSVGDIDANDYQMLLRNLQKTRAQSQNNYPKILPKLQHPNKLRPSKSLHSMYLSGSLPIARKKVLPAVREDSNLQVYTNQSEKKNLYALKMKMMMCNRPLKINQKASHREISRSIYGTQSPIPSRKRFQEREAQGEQEPTKKQQAINFDPIVASQLKEKPANFSRKYLKNLSIISHYFRTVLLAKRCQQKAQLKLPSLSLFYQMQNSVQAVWYIGDKPYRIKKIIRKNIYFNRYVLERLDNDSYFCIDIYSFDKAVEVKERIKATLLEEHWKTSGTISHIYYGHLTFLLVQQVAANSWPSDCSTEIYFKQRPIFGIKKANCFLKSSTKKLIQQASWHYGNSYMQQCINKDKDNDLIVAAKACTWLHASPAASINFIKILRFYRRENKAGRTQFLIKPFYENKCLQTVKIEVLPNRRWMVIQFLSKYHLMHKKFVLALSGPINAAAFLHDVDKKVKSKRQLKDKICSVGLSSEIWSHVLLNHSFSLKGESTGQINLLIKTRKNSHQNLYFKVKSLIFAYQNCILFLCQCSNQFIQKFRFFCVASFEEILSHLQWPKGKQQALLTKSETKKLKLHLSKTIKINLSESGIPKLIIESQETTKQLITFEYTSYLQYLHKSALHLCFYQLTGKARIIVFKINRQSQLLKLFIIPLDNSEISPNILPHSQPATLSALKKGLTNRSQYSYHYFIHNMSLMKIKDWRDFTEIKDNRDTSYGMDLRNSASFFRFKDRDLMPFWNGSCGRRARARVIKSVSYELVHFRQKLTANGLIGCPMTGQPEQ